MSDTTATKLPDVTVRVLLWALLTSAGLAFSIGAYVWHREVSARETLTDDQKSDHDVLIEVRTEVRQISRDVQVLVDHERTHHHKEE